MKELVLQTPDQFPISVKIFEPEIPKRKLLVINSATGVRQQVYFSFAKYLATQGFTVITYDYRGIGESKPRKMKGFEASMRIWGTRDFKTITGFIKENYPDYTKFCLGHSVGALILGMNEDSVIFKKFIFIATQDAYIGHLSWRVAVTAALGFGIAVPVTVILKGYFPAHRFGLGESLPKGSAYDWRTLILNKKSTGRLYEKIEKDYSKDLNQEAFIIHAEDDSWVTMKGMESLMNNSYPNMKKTYREIKVSESPKKQVGHINFFRSYNRVLWKIILDKIQ
ncbi:alpha/beta fold hydrolase [Chryseobacterium sp. VAUSW3]|uniref:alpha/beta hydrolase family protein n=1 Tax=Chryseobacterium sp. VAUSW3 TaxID=2010998 RepID=UPI000B4C6C0F|nr:alpha/beta fold hydrolase [Chryseobacterium sp. VAUSW3]OWR15267.1 alpha/beta hydrolase [Chryseobacterium sp. VAUSW3]